MFSTKKATLTVLVLVVAVLLAYYFLKGREGFSSAPKVTYYYLPGCPWCEKFMPEWTKFEGLAKQKGIATEKVNAKEKADEVAQKNIRGFPTVLITKDGKDTEYKGDRTADALLKAVA